MEQAGVQLVAQGAAAYMSDMRSATNSTSTFVNETEKGAGIVGRAGGMMGSAIKSVAAVAAGVGVAGFVALGKAIFDGVGDAREAARLNAATEQTIKTMGNAAGRSAEDVVALASALSDASGMSLFGDDQIQQASNLLLTFGNIKGETFDLATALTVDLAQALGGAPADQAMMLGKALNDPIKGITALGKAGLTFSEEQKAAIAAMVETGDIAGAQSIIIKELNAQVGGQAAAAAAADGGWTQLTATLGELQESVGAAVLPMLNVLVGILNESVMPVVTAVAEAFGGVIESLADAGVMSSEFGESVGYLATQLGLPGELIQDIVFAAQGVVESFDDAGAMSSEFGESIGYLASQLGLPGELVQDIVFAVQDLVEWFGTAGDESSTLGGAMDDLNGIWLKVQDVIENVADAYMNIAQAVLPVIQQFIADHGTEIEAFFKTTWDSIIEIINLALDLYNAIVPPVLNAIAGFINEHGSEIQKVLSGAWDMISALITGTLETIKGVIKTALALINGDWEGAWNGIKGIVDVQAKAIGDIVTGFLNIIAGIFDTTVADILKTWEDNWNMAVNIITSVDWADAGAQVVAGIKAGVAGAWDSFINWLVGKAGDALDEVFAAWGISSPAKEWKPIGEFAVMGLMAGFEDMWPALTDLVANMSDDLIETAADIGQSIQSAIAGGFGAVASIDRQMASNLDKLAKIPEGFYKKATETQLKMAEQQAKAFADPATGAKFFAMRSKQILEFQELQQKINKETDAETKKRLQQQQILILAAQEAEQSAFQAQFGSQESPMNAILEEMRQLFNNAELEDLQRQYAAAKSDEERARIQALINNAAVPVNDTGVGADLNALMTQLAQFTGMYVPPGTASPPASSTQMPPATGGGPAPAQRTFNMPIYTNNTPAALQQSLAIAEAVLP